MTGQSAVWLLDAEGAGHVYRGVSQSERDRDEAVEELLAAEGVPEVKVQRAQAVGWLTTGDVFRRLGAASVARRGGDGVEWKAAA